MEMKTVFTNVFGGCDAIVFRVEDGGSTYLQNISKHLAVCMASHLHSLQCENLKSYISINGHEGKLSVPIPHEKFLWFKQGYKF
jgi:hypothetical protein